MEYVCLSAIYRVAERGEVMDASALGADDIALFLEKGIIVAAPVAATPEPEPAPDLTHEPRVEPPKAKRAASNRKPRKPRKQKKELGDVAGEPR